MVISIFILLLYRTEKRQRNLLSGDMPQFYIQSSRVVHLPCSGSTLSSGGLRNVDFLVAASAQVSPLTKQGAIYEAGFLKYSHLPAHTCVAMHSDIYSQV